MASAVVESWVYITMQIENEWGEQGTGFLVYRGINDKEGLVLLVTNKNVLHEDGEMRKTASQVTLYLNIKNKDGSIAGKTAMLPLNLDDGSKRWREHPDPDVDVLAFDVTQGLVQYPQIEKRWADYTWFADTKQIETLDITMGDEILVIGYPIGLRHRTTNFPLLREGIIATRIGETLEDDHLEQDGTRRKRVLRGFIIDGATIPGSSGSPVVLKPVSGRLVRGKIMMNLAPPLLLGIIAETRFALIQTEKGVIPSFAGLGFAFDAETVKETIEQFFQ